MTPYSQLRSLQKPKTGENTEWERLSGAQIHLIHLYCNTELKAQQLQQKGADNLWKSEEQEDSNEIVSLRNVREFTPVKYFPGNLNKIRTTTTTIHIPKEKGESYEGLTLYKQVQTTEES